MRDTGPDTGKVVFIGAGPGDPELLTLKAARLIGQADLVLYAGSLVPVAIADLAREGARVEDSSGMTLEETHALLLDCAGAGGLAARVHTGDPALYGAVAEQAALLDAAGIPWEVVPGVTAAFAAAAAAKVGLTRPGGAQSVVVTRMAGRTPVPEAQGLERFAATGASLALYLSASLADEARERLLAGGLAADTPVIAARRVGWPDELVVRTTVEAMARDAGRAGMDRQTVFLVLPGAQEAAEPSKLYDQGFAHGFRDAEASTEED